MHSVCKIVFNQLKGSCKKHLNNKQNIQYVNISHCHLLFIAIYCSLELTDYHVIKMSRILKVIIKKKYHGNNQIGNISITNERH